MHIGISAPVFENSAFGKKCLKCWFRDGWKTSLKQQVCTSPIWMVEVWQQWKTCTHAISISISGLSLCVHALISQSHNIGISVFLFKTCCCQCRSWPCDRTGLCTAVCPGCRSQTPWQSIRSAMVGSGETLLSLWLGLRSFLAPAAAALRLWVVLGFCGVVCLFFPRLFLTWINCWSDSLHSYINSCTGTTEGTARISRRSSDCTQQPSYKKKSTLKSSMPCQFEVPSFFPCYSRFFLLWFFLALLLHSLFFPYTTRCFNSAGTHLPPR